MFDRCDIDTRSIIDDALGESRRRGHNWLGTEHVLLALVQHRELLRPEVAAILPDAETVAAALDAELDGPPRRDATAQFGQSSKYCSVICIVLSP